MQWLLMILFSLCVTFLADI